MLLTLPQKMLETFKIPQVIDIGNTFPTNPNRKPWAKRKPTDIKYLVIHHSASTGTLEAENRYHVQNNNWYKLSYHISIDRGRIVQINDLLDITSHAMGANDHGIGICVNWDLRLRGLTEFERNALYGVLITLKEMFPRAEVVGHNEISLRLANHRTSCPVISMPKLRADIESAEELLSYKESPSAKLVRAYALADRVSSLYERVNDPKYGKECNRKLMLLSPVEGKETAKEIYDRIIDLYKKAQGGMNEACRKMNLYADVYEQLGIL